MCCVCCLREFGVSARLGLHCKLTGVRSVAAKSTPSCQLSCSNHTHTHTHDYTYTQSHTQYLSKGGRFGMAQSAEKGCSDSIRCYG